MIQELQREKEVKGKTRTAWMYNFMGGRLTFPMSLVGDGRISNFYGRMPFCEDRGKKHRKLRTGAAQGAFNIEPLWWTNNNLIMVTEGVFDALTIISLGVGNIIAVTGLDNPEVFRAIENSGKIVGIALDNDKHGREKTAKLLAYFKEIGIEAYDYTGDEFVANPGLDFRDGDDFNSWFLRLMEAETQ